MGSLRSRPQSAVFRLPSSLNGQPLTVKSVSLTLETQPLTVETQPLTAESVPLTVETQPLTVETQPPATEVAPAIPGGGRPTADGRPRRSWIALASGVWLAPVLKRGGPNVA